MAARGKINYIGGRQIFYRCSQAVSFDRGYCCVSHIDCNCCHILRLFMRSRVQPSTFFLGFGELERGFAGRSLLPVVFDDGRLTFIFFLWLQQFVPIRAVFRDLCCFQIIKGPLRCRLRRAQRASRKYDRSRAGYFQRSTGMLFIDSVDDGVDFWQLPRARCQ